MPIPEALLTEAVARGRARRSVPEPARCRALRISSGVSQADLARVVGVSASALCRWERGSRRPSGEAARKYLEALARLRADLAAEVAREPR